MTGNKDASAPLIAAYDQAKAHGDELLDLMLGSISRNTADLPPVGRAVTIGMVLATAPEPAVREMFHAALLRLLARHNDQHPDGKPSYSQLYALAGNVAAHAPLPGRAPDRQDDEALADLAAQARQLLGLDS
jgi:hypothetical protein